MIPRHLEGPIQGGLRSFPAVGPAGPGGSGRKAPARTRAGRCFDLDQLAGRLRIDPELESLERGRDLVILDEVQAWPEIFPQLLGVIDRDRRRGGGFLLLGSVAPSLMIRVSESLAGRFWLAGPTPFPATGLRARPGPRGSL